jgi:hypothetical protein
LAPRGNGDPAACFDRSRLLEISLVLDAPQVAAANYCYRKHY